MRSPVHHISIDGGNGKRNVMSLLHTPTPPLGRQPRADGNVANPTVGDSVGWGGRPALGDLGPNWQRMNRKYGLNIHPLFNFHYLTLLKKPVDITAHFQCSAATSIYFLSHRPIS